VKESITLKQLAHQVKNLYNQANYIIKYQLRRKYFLTEFELMNILRYHKEMCYHSHYTGKRIHRGLFINAKGLRINADINSTGNIGRKVFPTLFSVASNYGIIWGAVVNPIRWKIS